jgi:hypothetical protein
MEKPERASVGEKRELDRRLKTPDEPKSDLREGPEKAGFSVADVSTYASTRLAPRDETIIIGYLPGKAMLFKIESTRVRESQRNSQIGNVVIIAQMNEGFGKEFLKRHGEEPSNDKLSLTDDDMRVYQPYLQNLGGADGEPVDAVVREIKKFAEHNSKSIRDCFRSELPNIEFIPASADMIDGPRHAVFQDRTLEGNERRNRGYAIYDEAQAAARERIFAKLPPGLFARSH